MRIEAGKVNDGQGSETYYCRVSENFRGACQASCTTKEKIDPDECLYSQDCGVNQRDCVRYRGDYG